MMNFNDVIAIIELAIKNNYNICSYEYCINITKNKDTYIQFELCSSKREKYTLVISSDNYGKYIIKDLAEADILRFKLTIENLKKYREKKLIEAINNFFPKEVQQPEKMTVNDLDDENE